MVLAVSSLISALALAAGPALSASQSSSRPQSVPRLVERSLDKASYVELARQWKQYIEETSETAEALVNLGLAYRYSGEEDAAVIAGRRAVEIEPNNPKALALLGGEVAAYLGDDEEALELLEKCRKIAPDYEWGLTTLAAVCMRRGDWAKSEEVFKTIHEQRVIPQPLRDFGYNLLVGLPQGAVLITGGDSDTFAPLSLQAGMKLRQDVVVINASLLNLPSYAHAMFERHPSIKPEYDIDGHATKETPGGKSGWLSTKLIERMMVERKASLYFAASANYESYGFKPVPSTEGINLRVSGEGRPAEESARLVLHEYRLDSATDWAFSWSLTPNISKLMLNYAASMAHSAKAGGISRETRALLLDKGLAIAEFHESPTYRDILESLRKK